MEYLFIPIVMILGALGRRIAGGLLNQWAGDTDGVSRVMGDTPARLIYGAALGLAALAGSAAWPVALAMVPAVWVGTTTGNFNGMAMGRAEFSYWHDFWGMTAHGALSAILPVGLAVLAGAAAGSIWIAVDCLLCAPLYAAAWNVAEDMGTQAVPASSIARRSLLRGFNGGSELGEAFWGAACALGTFLAFAV